MSERTGGRLGQRALARQGANSGMLPRRPTHILTHTYVIGGTWQELPDRADSDAADWRHFRGQLRSHQAIGEHRRILHCFSRACAAGMGTLACVHFALALASVSLRRFLKLISPRRRRNVACASVKPRAGHRARGTQAFVSAESICNKAITHTRASTTTVPGQRLLQGGLRRGGGDGRAPGPAV